MPMRLRHRYRQYAYGPWCGCWHHHYAPYGPPPYGPQPPWWAEAPDEDTESEDLREEIAALKEYLGEAEKRLAKLEAGKGAQQS